MTDALHWTAGIHHDGSELYVSNPLPTLGEQVTIRLRTPVDAPITRIFLRTAPDGENHLEAMHFVEQNEVCAYWETMIPVVMPYNTYRFKILSDEGAYWLTGLGISRADGPDMFDFKLLADFGAPNWLQDRVFYQIFPDRFYNGDPSTNPEPGAWIHDGKPVTQREWGEPPLPWKVSGSVDYYGGDLPGIQQKLEYLLELGINAIYLNPIFSSTSNHRYNISDFFTVDKYVGGTQALVDLRDALRENDIRLILDVTPNHTSSDHPWFTEAQKNRNAPTASFYTFYRRPNKYLAWFGVKTLPKLNYASKELRRRMYGNADSVLQFWLKAPYQIDGWRLDVYNMTARQGSLQLSEEVGREMRQAIKQNYPQAYIFGEHFYDATSNLQGDQLDAIMNYQGFNIPLWRWLAGYDNGVSWRPEIADSIPVPAEALVEQLDRYRAAIPWVIARIQFNQLCSHDTERILRIVDGDKSLVKLGTAMLMAYPGVPCIYYGDEVGLDGGPDPDNRRCMPWDKSEWDTDLREFHKRLIQLRKSQPALLHGGFQPLYAEDGLWMFQRQSRGQQLIVIGYRGADDLEDVSIPVQHAGIPNNTRLTDLIDGTKITVKSGALRFDRLIKGDAFLFEVVD